MITKFCLYSVFKNLRFADPFLVLFFLASGLSFTEIGLLLGFQHLLTVSTEVPSGYLADRLGRRRALVGCFLAYCLCYVVLGVSTAVPQAWFVASLYLAMSCFGFGEAMRTGSHKAIMLDYLDLNGQSDRATEVVGLTRSFSKYSAGASAICGGMLLFALQSYQPLFWLSALPAAAGVMLMLSYPAYLDGECSRQAKSAAAYDVPWRDTLRVMLGRPQAVLLIFQSVLFESQIKIIAKYFALPLFQSGMEKHGIMLASQSQTLLQRSGALWLGLIEFVRESVGGAASQSSRAFERWQGGSARALKACYWAVMVLGLIAIVTFASFRVWLALAVIYVLALTAIQNLRRPIFVSALNEHMPKSLRATILSAESVARALTVSAMLPVVGMLADRYGLERALILPLGVLTLGMLANAALRTKESAAPASQQMGAERG